jgi:hypothetical protein
VHLEELYSKYRALKADLPSPIEETRVRTARG